MRKIYSIVLMACAMLFSASVFAVDVTTRQQIQDAITGASEGQIVNILLKNNIDVNAVITINAGQIVNVDLSGHNMVAGQNGVFELRKGTLNITGTGTIEKTGNPKTTGFKSDAIQVYGSTDPTDAKWSNLTIGENVTVNVHGEKKKDTKDGLEEEGYMVETTNAITVMEQGTGSATQKAAYGVIIEIKGTVYGSKYGVKINGNVTQNVFTAEYDNRPYVHVASTAEVYCNPSTNNATAIYSSGVGRFLIEGYVHGASAVFVKSGTVELNDAVVKSDYVGTFNDDHTKKGSGVNARGSAITIQSQSNYAGGQAVTIKGDTKVEAGSGYAVEETITTGTTKVNSIVIEGGTLETGANGRGAILFTEATKNAADQETANIEIIGGNIENYVQIKEEGGNVVATTVDQFLPKTETDHYKTTAVTDENGKTTIVVTYFENTADKPVVANSVVAAADETGIDWTVTADTEETLTDNKILTYLEAISAANKQTLNVGDATHNVTLKVGRIVLGPKAKIVVAAGSRLIVDGKQGIVAPVTDNIVLKAVDQDNYAQFLFNPAVTSNRHPNATIEWVSQSFRVDANNRWNQPFGIPTAYSIKSIEADRTDHRIAFFNYNYENNKGWENIGYLYPETSSQAPLDPESLNKPFNYYQILCTSATPGTKVTMKGELVGNVNQTVNYLQFYRMGFANSYTADMDVDQILPTVPGANEALYINMRNEYGDYAWEAVSLALDKADYPTTKIAPMQAFIVLNRGAAASSEINYADFVWNPVMNPTSNAPRRINETAYDILKVTVRGQKAYDRVTLLEADRFTSALDRGEAEKYMNDGLNIYVTDDNPMGIFASDNINNTYLGFNCKKSGTYTLSFEQRFDSNLALVDLKTNEVINIVEGATYEFSANENEQDDYRFQIVKRQNVVTDVETVENNMKNGGVYTLTGMYLGNMSVWNTLPAGIYVVNGEKRVK